MYIYIYMYTHTCAPSRIRMIAFSISYVVVAPCFDVAHTWHPMCSNPCGKPAHTSAGRPISPIISPPRLPGPRLARGKRLHARSRHLENHRGSSVAFSNACSVAFSSGCSLCQWHVPKDCRFPSGCLLELSSGLQGHLQVEFNSVWCNILLSTHVCCNLLV